MSQIFRIYLRAESTVIILQNALFFSGLTHFLILKFPKSEFGIITQFVTQTLLSI